MVNLCNFQLKIYKCWILQPLKVPKCHILILKTGQKLNKSVQFSPKNFQKLNLQPLNVPKYHILILSTGHKIEFSFKSKVQKYFKAETVCSTMQEWHHPFSLLWCCSGTPNESFGDLKEPYVHLKNYSWTSSNYLHFKAEKVPPRNTMHLQIFLVKNPKSTKRTNS